MGFQPVAPLAEQDRPRSLQAKAPSSDAVELNWQDVAANEEGYVIRRSEDGGEWLEVGKLDQNTSGFVDTQVVPGRTYCYEVIAYQDELRLASPVTCIRLDEADTSNTGDGEDQGETAGPTVLVPPSGLSASVNGTTVVLAWVDNSTDEDGFEVRRSDSTRRVTSKQVPAGSRTFNDTSIEAGTTYCYRVAATKGTVRSDYSNEACQLVEAPVVGGGGLGGGGGGGGGGGSDILSPSSATLPEFQASDASLWTSYLRSLTALTKVHYTRPWPAWLLANSDNDLGVELARITHSVTISAETATQAEVEAAVHYCVQAAGSSPSPTLAIACHPWEQLFPSGSPPTDVGVGHTQELAYWQQRFQTLSTWIQAANQTLSSNVGVSAVLLWADRFTTNGNAAWDTAITSKYDAITAIVQAALPGARIEWRGRGMDLQLPENIWRTNPHFTLNESGAGFSCILDAVPELDRMRDAYRRTVALADDHGSDEVTPWIWLGSGARRQTATAPVTDDAWDYHLIYSWQLGLELSIPWFGWNPIRYAPWTSAEVVVLDGTPFSDENPFWPKHFTTYVMGAAGETELPECSVPATTPSSYAQVVQWLQALPPLQKVHYSWPMLQTILDDPSGDARYAEYIRITHAITLRAESVTQTQMNHAVSTCRQINAGGPALPARVALCYSPWHRVFPADLPPTDVGPMHDGEIALFRSRLEFSRDALAAANTTYSTNIQLDTILLDSERFFVKQAGEPGAAAWNEAMRIKYDAIYDVAKDVFPNARIDWYGRGAVQIGAAGDGWVNDCGFELTEKGDVFSSPLYRVAEITYMRESFRRTLVRAQSYGVTEVVPWIALGAGYREAANVLHTWVPDWNYDSVIAWQLGAEVNNPAYAAEPERFAPWSAASVVVFYPPPFDTSSPAWERHFVAYCRGAAGIPDLP